MKVLAFVEVSRLCATTPLRADLECWKMALKEPAEEDLQSLGPTYFLPFRGDGHK